MAALFLLRAGRPTSWRRPRNVDHRHALLLVVPAVKSLDAGDFNLVRPEEARDVEGGRLARLADLSRPLFLPIEGPDADHFALFIVVEICAALATQSEHGSNRRGKPDQARLHDGDGRREALEFGLRLPLLKTHSPTPHPSHTVAGCVFRS